VIALVLLATRLLKKYAPAGPKTLPLEALQILGRRNIDPRNMVYLLQCGERVLVVGASPQGLVTLAEITDPAEVAHLTETCRQKEAAGGEQGFGQFLQNVRSRGAESSETAPAGDLATQRLRARLGESSMVRSAETPPHFREDVHA
jgi:flagellar biogenesis protein FliO